MTVEKILSQKWSNISYGNNENESGAKSVKNHYYKVVTVKFSLYIPKVFTAAVFTESATIMSGTWKKTWQR